jgi:hypothetical protein
MSRFHVGLDLGQANDYTAIAVVEEAGNALHVRHLERFRHTLYPDVADRVEVLMDSPQLKGKAELTIDATGVGPAVTDIFAKRGRSFKAVKRTPRPTRRASTGCPRGTSSRPCRPPCRRARSRSPPRFLWPRSCARSSLTSA